MANKNNKKNTTANKSRAAIITLSILTAVSASAAVAVPLVLLNKYKNEPKTEDESTKAHEIVIEQPESTLGFTITCDKTTAKKGESLTFTVAKTTNDTTSKVPSQLIINEAKFDLVKNDNVWKATVRCSFIEKMNVSVLFVNASTVTHTVVFNLGDATDVKGELTCVKNDGVCLRDINKPSFTAPVGKQFKCWSSGGVEIPDESKFFINADTVFTAVYEAASSEIKHTLYFVVDEDEKLVSGSNKLVVDNGAVWGTVKANAPVITKEGYTVGDYYIPNGSQTKILEDTDTFTASASSVYIINISWLSTTSTPKITFKNKDSKTTFIDTTKTEYNIEVAKNTVFSAVPRPAVVGTEDTEAKEKYVPNGKWYKEDGTEYSPTTTVAADITLYAGYDTVSTATSHTYKVVFSCGIGSFTEESPTTVWEKTESAATTYTWANVKSSAPAITAPTGYTFIGWGLDDEDVIPEGTTRLVALFDVVEYAYYNINFHSTDEVAWSGTQSFQYQYVKGSTCAATVADVCKTLPTPTKTGSTLSGWSYTKDSVTKTVTTEVLKTTKLADMVNSDGVVWVQPVFVPDTTKCQVHFFSSNTDIGTLAGNLNLTVDINSTFSTVLSKASIKATPVKDSDAFFTNKWYTWDGYQWNLLSSSDKITKNIYIVGKFEQNGFLGKKWDEVGALCDKLELGEIDKTQFASAFGLDNMDQLIGKQGIVSVNNQPHIVTVVGTSNDDASTYQVNKYLKDMTTGYVNTALTFEFTNLISDENGFAIASPWNSYNQNWKNFYYNQSQYYMATTVVANLNPLGSGYVSVNNQWFKKGDSSKSSLNTTVLNMLPSKLQSCIKNVEKYTMCDSTSGTTPPETPTWSSNSYTGQLFLPSPVEMNCPDSTHTYDMKKYKYYENASQSGNSSIRAKRQVAENGSGALGAAVDAYVNFDVGSSTDCLNYAGCDIQKDGIYGCPYWLAGPYFGAGATTDYLSVYYVNNAGQVLNNARATKDVLGVAPMFCI